MVVNLLSRVKPSTEAGNKRVKDELAKMSPWAKLALYGYLGTMLLSALFAQYTVTGTLRIYPRIFFPISLFLQGTFYLCFLLALSRTEGRMFVKVRWHILDFTQAAVVLFFWQAVRASLFIFQHGNKMGYQPFESHEDLGTRYLLVNVAFYNSGIAMAYLSLVAIASYALGIDNPALVHYNSSKIIKVSPVDLGNS